MKRRRTQSTGSEVPASADVDGPSAEDLLFTTLETIEYRFLARCSYAKGGGTYRAAALLVGAIGEALRADTEEHARAASGVMRRAAFAIIRATGTDADSVFEFHRLEFRDSQVHDLLVDS